MRTIRLRNGFIVLFETETTLKTGVQVPVKEFAFGGCDSEAARAAR